jgi:23S rRNA pseudouridine2605 synthase
MRHAANWQIKAEKISIDQRTVVKQQRIMKKNTSTGNFGKFARKKSNAAIKEEFKQQKRKIKKEKRYEVQGTRYKAQGTRSPTGNRQPATSNQQPATGNRQFATGKEAMPLNKFIAHCGVCSRRDAVELIKKGDVKVNGQLISEPGHKVSGKDEIRLNGKKISIREELVYILLNKPKDYITTTEDPQGRRTVLQLIGHATKERVYPLGRLDRNTSGVLLLTNDGELSQQLTHPSHEIKKVYHIGLDRPIQQGDMEKLVKGITLEDGLAKADAVAYADARDKSQVGMELHSGKNRIVRRLFEHLGYEVKSLDRVLFAGLTKKNVERGKWRFLTEKEVRELKYLGKHK